MKQASYKLGRYHLVEEIAAGGMAEVYRAKLFGVEGFQKDFAIKKILSHMSQQKSFIKMLVDEAKVLVNLSHKNIVQVFELGKEDNTYFIVMEYVNGFDLKTIIQELKKKGETLPLFLICDIFTQILEGLHFAHHRKHPDYDQIGIVHRDISPQNTLISLDGDVKITDFGIAKIIGNTPNTQTGVIKGKYAYMSPEQTRGDKLDHRSDIFSLGVVLYELYTGVKCFQGKSDIETLENIRNNTWKLPDNAPSELKEILKKCLETNPENRYESAKALKADIQKLKLSVLDHSLSLSLSDFLEEKLAKQVAEKKEASHTSSLPSHFLSNEKTKELNEKVPEKTKEAQTIVLGQTVIDETIQEANSQPQYESIISKPIHSKIKWLTIPTGIIITFLSISLLWLVNPFMTFPQVENEVQQEMTEVSPEILQSVVDTAKDSIREKLKPQIIHFHIKTQPENTEIKINYLDYEEKMTGYFTKDFELRKNDAPFEVRVELSAPNHHSLIRKIMISHENENINEMIKLQPLGSGSLSVQIRPWGELSVNGKAQKPGQKLTLLEGKHKIQVKFPPEGKVLNKTITVKPNQNITCYASFGKRSSLSCR
jgi:serine/threonine protein kinase